MHGHSEASSLESSAGLGWIGEPEQRRRGGSDRSKVRVADRGKDDPEQVEALVGRQPGGERGAAARPQMWQPRVNRRPGSPGARARRRSRSDRSSRPGRGAFPRPPAGTGSPDSSLGLPRPWSRRSRSTAAVVRRRNGSARRSADFRSCDLRPAEPRAQKELSRDRNAANGYALLETAHRPNRPTRRPRTIGGMAGVLITTWAIERLESEHVHSTKGFFAEGFELLAVLLLATWLVILGALAAYTAITFLESARRRFPRAAVARARADVRRRLSPCRRPTQPRRLSG